MENLMLRNHILEEKLLSLENQTPKESLSRPSDGSCEGNTAAPPAEPCSHPRSPETAEEGCGHQGELKQSQTDRESGAEDACPDLELSTPEDSSDQVQEEEGQKGGDVLDVTEEVTVGPEQEGPEPAQGSESGPERTGSTVSESDATAGDEMSQAVNEGDSDPDDADDADVRVASEMQEAAELEEKEDVDSSIKLSKGPESFVDTKKDSRAQRYVKTSGRGTGTPSQRDLDLSKENLRLASENLELRFQLEQTTRDLPRLKDQVSNLKEFCTALKKEKAEVEKRLVHIRGQAGTSGKTVPELEKTIGLMKKVVERVQRENNTLKKSSRPPDLDRVAALEKENEQLKTDFQTLKSQSEAELISKLESKTKGLEKMMVENERLRKEMKREMGAAEKLRVTKTSLEVTNEKLEAELEEIKQRLGEALSKPVTDKAWRASVVTRMFENKMKELEKELSLKTSSLSELKLQLKEAKEREERAEMLVRQREDQVDVLKRFPAALKADAGASSGVQTTTRLKSAEPDGQTASSSDYRKVNALLQAAETEKSSLQAEVRRLKKQLESFDPSLLDELEDLKYNYNLEVKKNILLEEQLKKVCDQFGVQAEMPSVSGSGTLT